MINVRIVFMDGSKDEFVAEEAYFGEGFFHARDAESGEMLSYRGETIKNIGSINLEPPDPPAMRIVQVPQLQGVAVPFRRHATADVSREILNQDIPMPVGAQRIDPQQLKNSIRMPAPPPNVRTLGMEEFSGNETAGSGSIREAVRLRRLRSQGEG